MTEPMKLPLWDKGGDKMHPSGAADLVTMFLSATCYTECEGTIIAQNGNRR